MEHTAPHDMTYEGYGNHITTHVIEPTIELTESVVINSSAPMEIEMTDRQVITAREDHLTQVQAQEDLINLKFG